MFPANFETERAMSTKLLIERRLIQPVGKTVEQASRARCADPGRHKFDERGIRASASAGLMLVLVLVLQTCDHSWIGERGRVAERLSLGDVAQQPSHDFAGARLRQVGGEDHVVRSGDGTDLLDDVVFQLANEQFGALHAFLQRDGVGRTGRSV